MVVLNKSSLDFFKNTCQMKSRAKVNKISKLTTYNELRFKICFIMSMTVSDNFKYQNNPLKNP